MSYGGAEFITEPRYKYGETRCYIRDSDGYIIEVGQSTDLTTVNARPRFRHRKEHHMNLRKQRT